MEMSEAMEGAANLERRDVEERQLFDFEWRPNVRRWEGLERRWTDDTSAEPSMVGVSI